ncbi:HEPN domain-containing protein [Kosakonia sp. BK9b]
MASEAHHFIVSIVSNFKASVGVMNVLMLEPEEYEALLLLYSKLTALRAGIKQDLRVLTKASLDSNARLCLYQIYKGLNSLNNCLAGLRNTPLSEQFYFDFDDFKHAVNSLDALSGRLWAT